ncbi:MAG: hypothetical protein Q7U73_14095 [Rubrivivax sp.]|nr:hypothetical protein [Rubrivivax sp.]
MAAPLWLVGLLLLPLIRWLHRGGRHRREVPVSRAGLWRGAAVSPPAAGERRPPDPAWRRRALLTALFFAALSGPQLPQQHPAVTLWIDDSLSMLTREAQGTRLVEGLAQARSLLAEIEGAQVEVRTLGDPWLDLGALTDATVETVLAGAGRQEPAAPPAALLRRDRLHWLVTDGADGALLDWPGGRRPDRVVQVDGITRNVGLERLSARRNLNDPQALDLLLKVTNGGTAAETREVIFATAAGEAARSTVRIDAGASALVSARVPESADVRATLQPGDALAEDDGIVLDLAPLRRRRVATDPGCPGPLVAAVGAHPALALVAGGGADVEAALDCGSPGAISGVATVRVLADLVPTPPRGAMQWSSSVAASSRIGLEIAGLRVAARLPVRPGDVVLLAAGDEPVIVSRAEPSRRLETSLDFAAPAIARGPEIPLLVNLMFEHLFGIRLLDAIAVADRGTAASRVAPAPRARAAEGARAPSESRFLRDWAPAFLVAALVVLLWEIVALGRQWLRLSDRAQAGSE